MVDWSQPQVAAAVVASAVSLGVGVLTVVANGVVTAILAERKLKADRDQALSNKAWAEYELRRDVYMDVARQIDCLFAGGDPDKRPELHRTARKLRLVGSDEVVKALNGLFQAIRGGLPHDVLEQYYRTLFNTMRRDLRRQHALPPIGTDLDESAFPIES